MKKIDHVKEYLEVEARPLGSHYIISSFAVDQC